MFSSTCSETDDIKHTLAFGLTRKGDEDEDDEVELLNLGAECESARRGTGLGTAFVGKMEMLLDELDDSPSRFANETDWR